MKSRHAVTSMTIATCVLVTSTYFIACKNDKPASKAPNGATNATPTPTASISATPTVIADTALKLVPVDPTLQFAAGQTVRASFTVQGANGRTIAVGLAQAPAGSSLESASTASPIFVWPNPTQGTQSVSFILRDMAKCEAVETSVDNCDLSPNVVQTVKSYDVLTQTFSLTVGTAGSNVSATGLIAAILPIATQLITGAGTGVGTAQNLQNVLSQLNATQLQTILNAMQNGGNATDIIAILNQFGFNVQ